jgi:hypothetical protein
MSNADTILAALTFPECVKVIVDRRPGATWITLRSRDLAALRKARVALVNSTIPFGGCQYQKVDGHKVWSKGHYAESGCVQRKQYDNYFGGITVAS